MARFAKGGYWGGIMPPIRDLFSRMTAMFRRPKG